MIVKGERNIIRFVLLKCHLILILLAVGNIVRDVAYTRRM